MSIGRRTTKRLLTFGRRDLVFACFKEVDSKLNVTRLAALSISHPSYPTLDNLKSGKKDLKYTRAFQDLFITLTSPSLAQTHVNCVMKVDLGGHIPKWIFKKTVGQTGLIAFKAVAKKAVDR